MKTRVEKLPNYRTDIPKGHPYLVFIEGRFGWVIDSWHKTKREAMATARDYESLPSPSQDAPTN